MTRFSLKFLQFIDYVLFTCGNQAFCLTIPQASLGMRLVFADPLYTTMKCQFYDGTNIGFDFYLYALCMKQCCEWYTLCTNLIACNTQIWRGKDSEIW